jgi:hypothetical protein
MIMNAVTTAPRTIIDAMLIWAFAVLSINLIFAMSPLAVFDAAQVMLAGARSNTGSGS